MSQSQESFEFVERFQPAKMPAKGEDVKSSFRDALVESHVSAIAIALLLLFSFDAMCKFLLPLLFWVADLLVTAVAVLDVPFYSTTLTTYDRIMLVQDISPLAITLIGFSAAWLLSRWVYGAGPLRSLRRYHRLLARRIRA